MDSLVLEAEWPEVVDIVIVEPNGKATAQVAKEASLESTA